MSPFLLADAISNCVQKCINGGGSPSDCATTCMASSTSAVVENPALGDIKGWSGITFFQKLLPRLIGLALVIGVLVFVFIIIIGAIQWISSGGDKNAVEGAKGKITNAFVGIVILFAVFAILKVIESFFGVSILTLDIGGLAI